jgi:DNA (cytosine-5)-methyltransferase 1
VAAVTKYVERLNAAWSDHLAPRRDDAPTVISTFAGCGGSSLGYSMAGYRELLAVEWDDNAVETFRLNFPDVPVYHGDINALGVDQVLAMTGLRPGDLDVFDGSPPCQGFSTAGKRAIDDPRNSLFKEYVRLLRGLQPKAFVMENVSGMIKGKMKLVFAEILRELKACGYRVSARLLNAMYFDVPQERQRMIFIGVREDLAIAPVHPRGQSQPNSAQSVFDYPQPLMFMRNEEFQNKWRSAGKPSCTIMRSRAPMGKFANNVERELKAAECAILSSFPRQFCWIGNNQQQISRIGNSVPPLFMRAIAEHIRDTILVPSVKEATA